MTPMQDIAKAIIEGDNFVLGAHVGPDGDSLGALISLSSFLEQMGKKFFVSSSDARPVIPSSYKFMPNISRVKDSKESFDPDVFISLECPTLERLGVNNKLASKAVVLLNIDHHGDNIGYGTVNWIEATTSSTCEMLYKLSKLLPVKIDKDIAFNLYIGILTDTGRFQYSNVSPSTFEAAKELLKFGLDTNAIFKNIYENRSFYSTVLLGEILARASFFPKTGFIYSSVTNEDFLLNHIDVGETEHFIDSLRAIKGVKVAAIFKEVGPLETKVSLRSTDGVNVAEIAEVFGGGGHKAASGFTSGKSLKEAINDLKNIINENNKNNEE